MSPRSTAIRYSPYLDALRDVIRGAWRQNFPGMEASDSLRLAASLADTFVATQIQLPFPVTVFAALLVKFGLESLFGPLKTERKGALMERQARGTIRSHWKSSEKRGKLYTTARIGKSC